MFITLRVVARGISTTGLLECLAGSWISLLSTRRRMFCLLEVIFGALCVSEQGTVIRLSAALCDELLTVAALAPLAATDLRCPFSPFLIASDASLGAMAAVRAEIPWDVSRELCRTSLSKGRWTTLLSPFQSWKRDHEMLAEEDEVDEPYAVHPFWELCARGFQYKELWRKRVTRSSHINVLETKAYVEEEKRRSVQSPHLRILFALDSQVCLGALTKGRSASLALNAILKRSLPYPLAGGIFGHYLYYPSAFNRADGPTRDTEPKPPDLQLPQWFWEHDDSFFEGLDKWLASIGAEFASEIPFDSLGNFECADISPSSRIKRKPPSRGAMRRRSPCQQSVTSVESPSAAAQESQMPQGGNNVFCRLFARFPRSQFFFNEHCVEFEVPGVLDLYSGNFGVARQLVRHGAPWVLTFDWKRSESENLLNEELRDELLGFAKAGAFAAFGLAPICASMSRAITPAVRSRRWPRGIPGMSDNMKQKVGDGNTHASFCLAIITLALLHDWAFWCENPDKSFLWMQQGLALLGAKTPELLLIPFWLALGCYANVATERINNSLTLRVGEAKNPGPGQRFVPRPSLQELPTMSAATLALETKVLQTFVQWCRGEIRVISCEALFDSAPQIMVYLLRVFGDIMFQERKALSNFRHLLLAAQRWKPMIRPFMQPAWEFVNRWEHQEPVTHRGPIPEPLVRLNCPSFDPSLLVQGYLGSLGDLNHSHPFVQQQMLQFVTGLVEDYQVDAFRLDTVVYVDLNFVKEVQQAAGVEILGEATVNNLTYQAQLMRDQKNERILTGLLNFPPFYELPTAFCGFRMGGEFGDWSVQGTWSAHGPDMSGLGEVMMEQLQSGQYESLDLLANFADNHDENARVNYYCKEDQLRIKSSMAWVMLAQGIPIVYYGTEQNLLGHQPKVGGIGQDEMRESMWQSHFKEDTWQYQYIKTLNTIRKQNQIGAGASELKSFSEHQMIFTRACDAGKHEAWVFLNNKANSSLHELTSYCPGPLPGISGQAWYDAISGRRMDQHLIQGCFKSPDAEPKVLVLQMDQVLVS
eukprot:s2227_g5.t1